MFVTCPRSFAFVVVLAVGSLAGCGGSAAAPSSSHPDARLLRAPHGGCTACPTGPPAPVVLAGYECDVNEGASMKARIDRLASMEGARTVYGASHHRWQLAAPWSPEQLEAWEKRRRGTLPVHYRQWLVRVGSSGAGPGNGLFEPGTWSLGRTSKAMSQWTGRTFGPLGTAFPYKTPVGHHAGSIAGAMPVCDLGCGMVAVLVTAGPQRGRIWLDKRRDTGGFAPEDGFGFREWILAWLTESERDAANPWKPSESHPNAPDRLLRMSAILTESEVTALREQTLDRIRTDGKAAFGKLGSFLRHGERVHFDQGPALEASLSGEPLPDADARSCAAG